MQICIDYFRNKLLFDIVEMISKYILPVREGRTDKQKLKPKSVIYFFIPHSLISKKLTDLIFIKV